MATFVGIALAVIVTVDNALLAGLLLPTTSKQKKQSLIMTVGILLGISQVILATSVDRLLNNLLFRVIGIVLLGWMCTRTLGMKSTRDFQTWTMVLKLWLYTVVGILGVGLGIRRLRAWQKSVEV